MICLQDYKNYRCLVFSIVAAFVTLQDVQAQAETERIDELVRRWAPKIYLAPNEIFFPLSIEEFLEHVYPGDDYARPVTDDWSTENNHLPQGKSSKSLFLHTRKDIETLRNQSSFLNGRDPSKHPVPLYVIVTNCDLSSRTFFGYSNDISTDTNITEPDLHFHVTYWLFYPYNEGKEVCYMGKIPAPIIFNTCFGRRKLYGDHVGDFEHLSLYFRGKPYPDEIFLSVHDSGVYYKYNPVKKKFKYKHQVTRKGIVQRPKFPPTVRTSRGHPILFSAKGSHGLWSSPGDHYFVRVPRLTDQNGYGVVWKTWKYMKIFHLGFTQPPTWMKYQGRWGNPKSNCLLAKRLGICQLSDGPMGIIRDVQDFYCDKEK
ncbi:PREDICTED: uncharacterized protein LOC108561302 [Nicrophorus vespilloides]|uniref:Uncharacterized protein LOC108561302 n=1 Tax=Nicrophorus vespilloides TaxID=110193 RepID=A0ABM1MJE9_NICVS|nr:PREDICTED: uncharacterized protein LOC108561302 [Nicrophorus vespilloides]